MDPQTLMIEELYDGERIDRVLAEICGSFSRSYIQKIVRDNQVLINSKPVKASYRVKTGEEIQVFIPEPVEPKILPEDMPLDILYEDKDIIVVNKPKGMVVHPCHGHYSGTLVNGLLKHCREELSGINGVMRPGIVHRIDKDTTGVLVVCKNDFSHNHIALQLKEHSITRKYHAICCHGLKEDGVVNAPIGRDQRDRLKMAVNRTNGKEAVTHYHILEPLKDYTYIECRLETGRTHQIRVHMASIGHPLLGDTTYGPSKCPFSLEGQTLHAKVLGFLHPRTGEYMEFEAPLPEYFSKLLEHLRKQ